ncbi:2-amino-4-hydroxy-6-hydroxymethyldihydropteridine diphosphokinase [uncultured Oxalicibacterium sp.]|uniref:2-amino-4-hydroxy-6- hydroxymethyldihydropteridine diphosphokinase n=1 Tax=uncultured Oxalicibacterium sp. TaxID=1168540 RepID=UPI0025E50F59|nr:2-amino-4-hydroxy-6-hydroxymethyldihydropteridine diphosphokinase [uncultured Oxalicibacterium sp.]
MTVPAYIGIGANLGDAQATVTEAITRLDSLPHTCLTARSSLYRTAPIDAGGDDYVNAVAQLQTTLPAQGLLDALLDLEQQFGRERPYVNAPRTLDLDLLLYGEECIDTATLTVPHPRMTQRAFVLIPLLEIAPHVVLPGAKPAQDFLKDVRDQAIMLIR